MAKKVIASIKLQVQAGKFATNEEQLLSPAETTYSDGWLARLPMRDAASR